QPVKALSGGEQCRLLLARALARPSNLLILDEPTNDLDMDTLDLMQELLADYDGTLLLVSHDRDFLDRVVTSVIGFEGDGVLREYPGGYSDFIRQRKDETAASSNAAPGRRGARAAGTRGDAKPKQQTQLSYKDGLAHEQLQKRMPEIETEIAALEKRLADPDLYAKNPQKFAETTEQLDALRAELAQAEERWLELEMKREELSGS
ncbi:MAG: ATP-binding cassette domain-containing protein, partial [Nitratireductor sp.]